jgi:hypothetical protein
MIALPRVTRTYGRFVLEENTDCVRLRVRSTDSIRLWRVLTLVGVASVLCLPTQAFETPATLMLWLCLYVALIRSGIASGSFSGVARSRYARVKRLVEVRWGKQGDDAGGSRVGGSAPTLIVDGQSFAPKDFVGVVTATSTEWAGRVGQRYDTRVVRFRPTLMLRHRAFELDVLEGADEASARDLSDAMASAIARRPTKAPSIAWDAPAYNRLGCLLQTLEGLFLSTSLALGMVLCVTHSRYVWTASATLLLGLATDVASTEATARNRARARDAATEKLLVKARAAVAESGL